MNSRRLQSIPSPDFPHNPDHPENGFFIISSGIILSKVILAKESRLAQGFETQIARTSSTNN